MVDIDTTLLVLIAAAGILIAAAPIVRGRWGFVLLAAGLFALLGALALGINSASLTALDTSVADWFDLHRTPRRETRATGIFGYIGRPIHVLIPAVVVGALLSLRARSVLPVLCLTGGVGIGVIIEGTLKATITRTATTEPLVHYPHSFPSGHVTGASAFLGMIAVCLGVGAGRAAKGVLAAVAVAGILYVAVLALYTGAHTFTDVIGGGLLGGGIVALGAAVLSASRRRDPVSAPPASARR